MYLVCSIFLAVWVKKNLSQELKIWCWKCCVNLQGQLCCLVRGRDANLVYVYFSHSTSSRLLFTLTAFPLLTQESLHFDWVLFTLDSTSCSRTSWLLTRTDSPSAYQLCYSTIPAPFHSGTHPSFILHVSRFTLNPSNPPCPSSFLSHHSSFPSHLPCLSLYFSCPSPSLPLYPICRSLYPYLPLLSNIFFG